MPKFNFMPLHRLYEFYSGGALSRTVVVAEVNLPSGVGPGMFDVDVVDVGNVLQVTVEWPAYLLQPLVFNAQWLDGTGDGTLHRTSSRIASSQKSSQDLQREFGEPAVKSIARIPLLRQVEQNIVSWKYAKLGFLDKSPAAVKANGLAIQVLMLAVEDFATAVLPSSAVSDFAAVVTPTETPNSEDVEGSALTGV